MEGLARHEPIAQELRWRDSQSWLRFHPKDLNNKRLATEKFIFQQLLALEAEEREGQLHRDIIPRTPRIVKAGKANAKYRPGGKKVS